MLYHYTLIKRANQVQKRQRTTRRYKVQNLARTSEWNQNFLWLPSILCFLVVFGGCMYASVRGVVKNLPSLNYKQSTLSPRSLKMLKLSIPNKR